MLQFLEIVKAYKATSCVPFICVRARPTQLKEESLAAMREACEALGALAYLDLAHPERKLGVETVSVEFRDAVRAAVRAPKDAQGLRVLVADDNADAAHTLAVLLRMAGHHVQKAGSGADALRIAGEFHPMVVVLDIAMPGLAARRVSPDAELKKSPAQMAAAPRRALFHVLTNDDRVNVRDRTEARMPTK